MAYRGDIDRVVEQAERQDQVVARRELLAVGIGRSAVEGLIDDGVLRPVFDGTYLVGAQRLSQRQLLRSAVIYSGPRSGLSGRSTAEHRGLLEPRNGWASVRTTRGGQKRLIKAKLPMDDDHPGFIKIRPTTRSDFQV